MKSRSTTAARKWQRQRAEDKRRLARVKAIKADIDRVHAHIWRLDTHADSKLIAKLRSQLRTLEVRLRYIGSNT